MAVNTCLFEQTGSHAVPALQATLEQYFDPQSGARHIHMATDAQESAFLAGFPTLPGADDGRAQLIMPATEQDRRNFVTILTSAPEGRRHFIHHDFHQRRYIMTWQTPQAIDVRLGFEITMYISNR